ncbi:MAG: transposase [Verrucomicrobiales bacterium]|nr:transposase [Verrucomicrobiales bacterium]
MKRKRFSEEQIIGVLRESGAEMTTKELCAKHNISLATFYAWKRKYGDMDGDEVRRLKAMESENARLKRIVAELTVQNDILKEVNQRKW